MTKVRTVYSTQDDGAGTLRDALRVTASYTSEWIDAGALSDGDIIDFSDELEVDGVITIVLSSQLVLPATDLTIDGGSHTGSGATLATRIVLDAQQLGRVIYGAAANKVEIYNVTFKDGQFTVSNYGAGVYTRNSTDSGINVFEYCVFKQTYSGFAATNGGGLYAALTSQNTLTNCTFNTCSASSYGGGLCSYNSSQNTLTNCTFNTCSASSGGGGIFSTSTSQNTLTNCTFDACSASSYGGALYSYDASQNTLTDCTFNTCSSNNGGGMCASSTSQNSLTDCTFDACSASSYGGALYSASTSQTTLNNCTFVPPANNTKATVYNNGTNTGGSLIINGAIACDIVQFTTNTTTIVNGNLTAEALTISNGATVTFSGVDSILAATTTAIIGSSTFTAASNSTGYAAFPDGTNISAATFGGGVTSCVYGADVQTFTASSKGASWTAVNLQTPILIEIKNGDAWETVTKDATGGSYETTFAEGATVRSFDGARFLLATTSSDAVVSVFGSEWSDVARYALGIKTNPDTPL